MLGCLIPVGEALKDTGAAGLRADGLTLVVGYLSGNPAVGFILLACMPSYTMPPRLIEPDTFSATRCCCRESQVIELSHLASISGVRL